ncbi:MAG: hypothetical protein AAFN07_01610 [Pseudomonadota bacterium]
MTDTAGLDALEREVAQRIAQSVAEGGGPSLADLLQMADDYESLSLMRELPESATMAQTAIAELPGVETLSPAETAQLLARIYRRAIQLAGQ